MPSFETRDPISVTLEITQGDVQVIATDRLDTVVAVNPSDRSRKLDVEAAEQTQVEYSNGRLRVKGPKPRGLGGYISFIGVGGRLGSIDVTIELPANSRIQVDSVFVDFRGADSLEMFGSKAAPATSRSIKPGRCNSTPGPATSP